MALSWFVSLAIGKIARQICSHLLSSRANQPIQTSRGRKRNAIAAALNLSSLLDSKLFSGAVPLPSITLQALFLPAVTVKSNCG
jgi:hypothetical protein